MAHDSHHLKKRSYPSIAAQATVECLSVRLWCVGAEEWPTIVGQLVATIHQVLDPILPEDAQHTSTLRKSLPPAFRLRTLGFNGASLLLPIRSSPGAMITDETIFSFHVKADRGQALVRRLSTLFRALHHCMVAPSPNHESRAVPVPMEHILDLVRRVLTPSPANFVRIPIPCLRGFSQLRADVLLVSPPRKLWTSRP